MQNQVKKEGGITKGTNPNAPKKGSKIKVEPIKKLKDIETIKKLLSDNKRDYCLFTVGINTNLRASDLCRITAGQVRGLKSMDSIEIKEKKTSKMKRISFNKECVRAIERLLASREYKDTDPLFFGQRGPIKPTTIHKYVKAWCSKAINLKGNYGSHTLRKTWGYHQRVTFSAGIPELMVAFNHSTQRQTLDYLCVQPEEVRSLYANEL